MILTNDYANVRFVEDGRPLASKFFNAETNCFALPRPLARPLDAFSRAAYDYYKSRNKISRLEQGKKIDARDLEKIKETLTEDALEDARRIEEDIIFLQHMGVSVFALYLIWGSSDPNAFNNNVHHEF